MLDLLLNWDEGLFRLVNGAWNFPLFDAVLPWLRNKYVWAPLYLFIICFFLYNYGKNGVLALLYLGITILFCDQLSSDFIKPFVQRMRPCHDPLLKEQVRLLAGCGGPFSFPSSHAANHFGVATFLGGLLWNRRWVLPAALLWAFVICYAQVYVGVHYPLDIAGGAALGGMIGGFLFLLCKRHLKTDDSTSFKF